MKDSNLIKSERILFFHFVKAVGILGIFLFHLYGRFIGELRAKNAVTSGLLQSLFVTINSLEQFFCFIAQTFFTFGNIGVDLFIISSGFGLCYSYLSKKTVWGAFYRKRIVRVLPLYYFFLFLVFCLTAYVSKVDFYVSPEGLKVLLYHVLLVQTFNGSYVYYGLYYFIAVIFQLYLIFPFLVKCIKNNKIRVLFFLLSLFISSFINIIFELSGVNYKGILITDYLPLFFFGMLLADSMYNGRILHKVLFNERISFISILLLVVVVYFLINFSFYNRIIRTLLAVIVLLGTSSIFRAIARAGLDRLIRLISYVSYVFYLSHMIFINRVLLFLAKRDLVKSFEGWILAGVIILPASVLFAYIVQKGYDRISVKLIKGTT